MFSYSQNFINDSYSDDYYDYDYNFDSEDEKIIKKIEEKLNITDDSKKFLFTKSYPMPIPSTINPSKSYIYHNLLSLLFFNVEKKIKYIDPYYSLCKKYLYKDKNFYNNIKNILKELKYDSKSFWYMLHKYQVEDIIEENYNKKFAK